MKIPFSKKFISISICAIAMIAVTFNCLAEKSKAAFKGYYNTYNNIKTIELDNNFTSSQGFNTYGNYAFFVKIANKGTAKYNKSRIWACDLNTGGIFNVYNGGTGENEFEIGHANCIYVDGNYLYIATMDRSPAIIRYSIYKTDNAFYLEHRADINVCFQGDVSNNNIAISGIEYAPELDGYIVKSGNTVYVGDFDYEQFIITKSFTIDTNIEVNSNKGVERINTDDYTKQGVYYKDGYLYMPMTNTSKMNQSIIVAYKLDSTTPAASILEADSDTFLRITSSTYGKLFEIENVAHYNGEMYANVNATDNNGNMHDMIIKFKEFTFNNSDVIEY